ncbi:MAG: PAS domain S-box protein, partial [Thermomicrobiaceae bacterium]|nr:PAS domain S-box protein [Thermomicrobiaceae bacterium]
ILQQLPVGVLIAEAPSGRVVLWNEQVETILGHPLDAPASVEAYGAWTAYWSDGRPVRPDEWPLARATLAGEVVAGAELEFVLPGGRRRWLSINAAPIRDADGRIVAGVVTFYDIDDRKRSEQALRESEDRFRAFFDHAVVGMSLADPSGRLIQVNQAYCDILGYSAEELLALDYRAITHPDDLVENEARVRDLLEGRAPMFAMEKRYVGKDGRVVHARVSASLVRGPAGEPRYFVAITEDVSVRKAAEEALRESEERLRVAAEATGLGTWDFYPATGELIWSDRCKALFGLPPEAEVDYPTFLALVHPEDRERVDAVVMRALDPASGGAYSVSHLYT